jgi:hypothetical protein
MMALVPAAVAATVALNHMDSLPSLIVTAPGYLVQAWLFERHWALGGAGYAATIIGVSAVFWGLLVVIVVRSASYLAHRLFRGRAA